MRLLYSILRRLQEESAVTHALYKMSRTEFANFLEALTRNGYLHKTSTRTGAIYRPTPKGLAFLESNRRFEQEIPSSAEELPEWVRFEGDTYRPSPKFQDMRFPLPDDEPYEYDRWHNALEAILAAVLSRGGKGKLEIAPPATKEEAEEVEKQLGFELPVSFKKVVLHVSRNICFYWNTADVQTFRLNGEHAFKYYGKSVSQCHIVGGGFVDFNLWDLDAIVALQEEGDDHYYLEEEEEYKHWSNSFIFSKDGAGNYFGIDTRYNPGEVIYLPKDGEFYGYRLAPSFESFMHNWTDVGCSGLGISDWVALSAENAPYLNRQSHNAKMLKQLLLST